MKRLILVALCAALPLSACSSTPSTEDTQPTENAARAGGEATETMLDIHEINLLAPTGDPFFTLKSNGELHIDAQDGPFPPGHVVTITADGKVTLADTGEAFLTLTDAGPVLDASGAETGMAIAKDGTATNADAPGKPLTFDDEGNIGEGDSRAKVTHVDGEDNPRSRRAVSLAFISFFIYAQKKAQEIRYEEGAMEEEAMEEPASRGAKVAPPAANPAMSPDEEDVDQM